MIKYNIIATDSSFGPVWFLLGSAVIEYIIVSIIKMQFSKTSKSKTKIIENGYRTPDIFGQQRQDFTKYSSFKKMDIDWRVALFAILTLLSISIIQNKYKGGAKEISYSETFYNTHAFLYPTIKAAEPRHVTFDLDVTEPFIKKNTKTQNVEF
ncbi:MAG: hypothetical protein JXQ87_01670 [Bacteroidia bacterium]